MLGERGPLELLLPQLVGLERGQIDSKVIEHARFVDPVIVSELRSWWRSDKDTGWDGEKVFKIVFRFWKVLQAYQSKRAGWSHEKGQRVLDQLKKTFGAGNPSDALLLLFGR